MHKSVLAPHTEAGRWASSQAEIAPAAWPGTYVPNFSEWRCGDIVLVRKAEGTSGTILQAGQAVRATHPDLENVGPEWRALARGAAMMSGSPPPDR